MKVSLWKMGAMLCLALLASFVRTAEAQLGARWDGPYYETSGSFSLPGGTMSWPANSTGVQSPLAAFGAGTNRPSATISGSGTIKATFYWINEQGVRAIPPPDKATLPVLVTSSAMWSVTTGDPSKVSASGLAENGFDDPEVPVSNGYGGRKQGKHLLKLNGTLGTAVCIIDLSATASGSSTTGGGMVGVSVGATVAKDTRSASLSRRGARGEVVDGSGNTHGDTIYSHLAKIWTDGGLISGLVENWQQFDVTLNGSWSLAWDAHGNVVPNVDWFWRPAHSQATVYWNKWLVGQGNQIWDIDAWKGVTGPVSATMTYKATDRRDGATATALYHFTVHDPIEERESYIDRTIRGNVRSANSPSVENQSYTETITVPGGTAGIASSYTVGVSISLNWPVSVWSMDKLGISPSFTRTVQINASQQTPPVTLPPRTFSYAVLFDTYERHWGEVTKWDEGGFVGVEPYDYRIPREPGWGIEMAVPRPLQERNVNSGG